MSEKGEISRRQFLTGAGLVVGGAAIGAGIAYPLIPGTEKEVQVPGPTKTVEVPLEVPTFVAPDGKTFDTFEALVAYMESLPGGVEVVNVFTCPYDSQEFASLAALGSHLDAQHGGREKTPAEVVTTVEGLATLNINGQTLYAKVEPNWSLAYVLREKLGLTGTKRGCDVGNCGVCTVIMDGRPTLSCLVLAVEAGEGHQITTIEGLSADGELTPLQQAMVENDATQCGFCTPGQVMTATALLDRISKPTLDEIKEFMAGTLCRCGTHTGIHKSILQVGS